MRGNSLSNRIAVALGLMVVGIGVLVWLIPREDPVAIGIERERAEVADVHSARALEASEPPPSAAREAPPAPPSTDESQAASSEPPQSSAVLAVEDSIELQARFIAPDRSELAPMRARVELVGDRGTRRVAEVEKKPWVHFSGLPLDRYVARVEAAGFVHEEQILDLAAVEKNARSDHEGRVAGTELTAVERLVLWPEGWIAVHVWTNDGRPLNALADDLGLDGPRLFFGAFDVRTSLAGPDDSAWQRPIDRQTEPGLFFRGWQLPGGAIGSVQVRQGPPLWIGLAVHGVPLGWELVPRGAREVVFRLDADALAARCARLRLRVVDAAARAPLTDARVTLRADNSQHRRTDQQDRVPDGDGRLEFAWVVPGRYELAVARGESLAQQFVELAGGELRDLGDVALTEARGVDVLTVDGNGEPVAAYVELGSYGPGKRVDHLYPAMLRWGTRPPQAFRLPMPTDRSIVRASSEMGRSNGRPRGGRWSDNIPLDPEAPPASPLVLVLRVPVDVRFETAVREVWMIEAIDVQGVVVDWTVRGERSHFPLIPGRYRVRFLDAAGGVLGELPFEVGEAPLTVVWP